MKKLLIPTIIACLASLSAGAQTTTYYDWQFEEAAGSAVFPEAANAGTGTNSFGDWEGYTTDGSGNWVVDGTVSENNRFNGMILFPTDRVVTDGVWIATMTLKSWELASAGNSTILIGFTDSANNHTQAKFANGGTQIRLIGPTFISNFGNDSHSSSAFTSPGILLATYSGAGDPVEGAPAITGNSKITLKLTVDLDGDTFEFAYAVDGGDDFVIESGAYTADIQKLRVATANVKAGDTVLIERLTMTGTGTVPAQTWNGYVVEEDNWVDTGSWLGWVNTSHDPWIWNDSIQTYTYMPDSSGWAYVTN